MDEIHWLKNKSQWKDVLFSFARTYTQTHTLEIYRNKIDVKNLLLQHNINTLTLYDNYIYSTCTSMFVFNRYVEAKGEAYSIFLSLIHVEILNLKILF